MLNENLEIDNKNYVINDLEIKDIIPNVIDNFMVTIIDGHQTIIIPSSVGGMQFKAWYRDRGGVFSKDVLQYALYKYKEDKTLLTPLAKYVHIKGNDTNIIARLISEEELFSFNTLKLVDGQIKDYSYMILKHLDDEESLTDNKKLISDKDIYTDIEPDILSIPVDNSVEEDPEYHTGSISLFNE